MKEFQWKINAIESLLGERATKRMCAHLNLDNSSIVSDPTLIGWIMTPWGYDAVRDSINHNEYIDLQGRPVETGSHDILEAIPAFKLVTQRPDGLAEKELCFNLRFKQQDRGNLNLLVLAAMFAYDIVMFHHRDFILSPEATYDAMRAAFVKGCLPLDGPYINFSMNAGTLTGGFRNGLRFGKFNHVIAEHYNHAVREAAKGVMVLNGRPTGFLLEHRQLIQIEKYLPAAHLAAKSVQDHVAPEFAKWGIKVDEVYMGEDKLITSHQGMQNDLLAKYNLLKDTADQSVRETMSMSPINEVEVVDDHTVTRTQTGTEKQ